MDPSCGPSFTSAMSSLASIGYEYGPFFFAVLFILVIPRSAGKLYSTAAAGSEDKFTYRNYFYASWGFGMLLVASAVAWWAHAQESHYTFTGQIVALNPNQSLAPVSNDQNTYYKRWPHDGEDKMADFLFAVVLDHPVSVSQTFRFNYWELVPGSGGVASSFPPPTAMLQVPVSDPTHLSQKYVLRGTGAQVKVVPFD